VGDLLGEANCIKSLGDVALRQPDHETALSRYEEALPLYRRVGSVLGAANCIRNLGDIALQNSDHETAQARYEEALPLYQRVGDVQGEANCILGLGDIAATQGDTAAANERYEAALGLYDRIPEPYSIGRTYRRFARITEGSERAANVARAVAAWQSIGRTDLLEGLDREFPPEPAAIPGTPPAASTP
jgi:tetratricopeptide (TPR) repeat protein